MIPPPPLDADGKLATVEAVVVGRLVGGVVSACCVCAQSSAQHWDDHGSYTPLHRRCVDRLFQEWRELIRSGQVDAAVPTGKLTGAYARRAAARGQVVTAAPTRGVSRSPGSPYFLPGMPEGSPWAVVAETNRGRQFLTGDEAHVRSTMERWRILSERDLPTDFYGTWAVSAALVDPTGAVVGSWGHPMNLDAPPRWEPLTRVQDWTQCRACSAVLWPLRLVTMTGGRCRACVEPAGAGDPRVWPLEPTDPGMDARPVHLGGPKPRKASRGRESS